MSKLEDLTGKRFGYLTVISRDTNPNNKRVKWLCRCDCNKLTVVASCDLKSGHTSSCGCKKFETHNQIHGMKKTRLYEIWSGMKKRCYNPNCKNYSHYGGRGIGICDDWQSFIPFYQWAINNGYDDKLTIERIDVNSDYCPENCKWATPTEQNNNRTNTILISYHGVNKSIADWCRELNLNYKRIYGIYRRLSKKYPGVTLEQIIERSLH